jgi:hypothetical protein
MDVRVECLAARLTVGRLTSLMSLRLTSTTRFTITASRIRHEEAQLNSHINRDLIHRANTHIIRTLQLMWLEAVPFKAGSSRGQDAGLAIGEVSSVHRLMTLRAKIG